MRRRRRRRRQQAYVVAPLLLLKLGLLGTTLMLNAWLATLWGVPLDPFTAGYAIGGLGSLAVAGWFLRGRRTERCAACRTR